MKQIVIAYIPVVHAGYVNFLKKYTGDLFILGEDIIADYDYLVRDARALKPIETKHIIDSLNLMSSVSILSKPDLQSLQLDEGDIFMPDEDVSYDIAETYLKNKKIKFDTAFLRWDKNKMMVQNAVEGSVSVTTDEVDKILMSSAFEQKNRSSDWWRQVGAVAVKDGAVLISGYNKHMPSPNSPYLNGDPRSNVTWGDKKDYYTSIHGEQSVIAQAAQKGMSLEGASLYVTTFPCPTCARLIAVSGIKKVYFSEGYSALDAQEILTDFAIEIIEVI
jgi:dCMP deaminase